MQIFDTPTQTKVNKYSNVSKESIGKLHLRRTFTKHALIEHTQDNNQTSTEKLMYHSQLVMFK